MRFMCHERQNKCFNFPYGPRSWLIRALLYTYSDKTVSDETLLCSSVSKSISSLHAHVQTASQPIRLQKSFRISVSIKDAVY